MNPISLAELKGIVVKGGKQQITNYFSKVDSQKELNKQNPVITSSIPYVKPVNIEEEYCKQELLKIKNINSQLQKVSAQKRTASKEERYQKLQLLDPNAEKPKRKKYSSEFIKGWMEQYNKIKSEALAGDVVLTDDQIRILKL